MTSREYVTVKRMREIEANAINKRGITAAWLMENAGKLVANAAQDMRKPGEIAVFSGYGNNGGDGMVAARYLMERGYGVKVFLTGSPRAFSPEAGANHAQLIISGCEPEKITGIEEIEQVFHKMPKPALIIDAIFGIGIRGVLDEFYLKLIKSINAAGSLVLAVDVPSGLDADTGEPLGVAVRADRTVALGYPKAGFNNPIAKACIGELTIADIGLT